MNLEQFFKEHPRAAVAFSGGVDSAYLLSQAVRYGESIKAYYVKSDFQPEFELADARMLAEELGADMEVLRADVLSRPEITSNPKERCYYCKRLIFGRILEKAQEDGYNLIIDGTNASDDAGDRPGMRALKEMKVISPLRECGLRKDEIRRLSKEEGLFTWDKPAYACLATRIPSGQEITKAELIRTETAEEFLFSLGLRDFRVRTLGNTAKLQVTARDFSRMPVLYDKVRDELRKYYSDVLLDLEVRDGK